MKKYLLGLITLALAVLMLLTPGCTARNASGPSPLKPSSGGRSSGEIYSAEIAGRFGDTLLLCAPDGAHDGLCTIDASVLDIYGEDGRALTAGDLSVGMTVDVSFDGYYLEVWPAILSSPTQIRVTGRSDGLIGLYFQVILDLIEADEGLNNDIEFVSLDLTEAGPLSENQRQALLYLTTCELRCTGLLMTFEQLREEGYIPEDDLIFENGLLFTITLASESFQPSGFSFSASKWRSGEGAYYLNDCSASPSGSGWSYTVGSFAIA